jgi:hypothetical protein
MSAPAAPMMMMMDPNPMNLCGQISNTRADILAAGANNTSAVLQSGSGDTQTLLQTACGDTAAIIAATERQSFHTQAGSDRNAFAQANANSAGFFESRNVMNLGAAENRATTNLNGVESRGLLNSNFFEARNTLNNGFTANLLAAKDAQLAIAISEGKVRNEISEVSGLLSGQISASREAISGLVGNLALQNQLELSKYFAISEREMNKQFALATLAASQNAAKIQADVQECCCEVKAVVNSTASVTQGFIQASEANRVRDELANARQENLFLRLRVPLPPV